MKQTFQTSKHFEINISEYFYMPELKDFIKNFRESKKWTQVEIADKIGISSQLYGKYEAGKHNPKTDFYDGWEQAFGQDLRKILKEANEPNVSRGMEKHTPVQETGNNKEMNSNHDQVYRTIVEGHTEYVLIPRSVLSETQLVSTEQINKTWQELAEKNKELERKNKQLDFYQEQFAKLMDNLELAPKPPKTKEV